MNRPNDRLLRISLRANAAFSATCGAALLAAPAALAGVLGVAPPILISSLGAQLLLFAGLLVLLASRPSIRLALAMAVVLADLFWVAGTVPLVAGGVLSQTGNWVALAIADVVLLFAILQFVGIRRAQRASVAAHA